MSKQKLSALVVLTALLFAPLVHGAVYRWTDEQGVTHFSDAPPTSGRFETVPQPRLPPADPAAQRRLEELLQSQKQAEEDRQKNKQDKMQMEEEKAARADACRRAKEQLAVLESRRGPRIRITEPDGTQRRLTEEERQARLAETQKRIADFCEE